jgi:hypothetical protein
VGRKASADRDAAIARATALRSVRKELMAAGQRQERQIDALWIQARSQRGLDHREPSASP